MRQTVNANKYLNDPTYYHYLIQYQGDIESEITKYPDMFVKIINEDYAILFIPRTKIDLIDEGLNLSTIVYIKPPEMYTLQDVSPVEASQAALLQLNQPLKLTGKNVDVVVIDTGIDYLSEEFMDDSGNTRIKAIWDQTVESEAGNNDQYIPYGTVYNQEQIQNAINASRNGEDPYAIVPSKDTIGHGTAMAGIIGARGKNPQLKGVAPECNLIVVKLSEDLSFSDVFKPSVPVFNITSIFSAFAFVYRYYLRVSEPLIVLLPLGSNLGTHKGNGIVDQYIEFISATTQICIVTCAGNERMTGSHISGNISEGELNRIIDIDIPPEEKNLWIDVWVDTPNILLIDIISPSGENTGVVNSMINETLYYKYIFEKTSVKVNYYIPEQISGDELIRIRFYDLQPGIWRIRVTGALILDGSYDMWMPQKGIISDNTHFTPYNTYNTVTNPGNCNYTVTIAAYNQNNNNIVNYSGVSANNRQVIDVAAGGVNALTVAPNNQTAIYNGTSVASAVAAGACAMLIQWAIGEKNNPYIREAAIKSYLAIGVSTRRGDIYPNPQWGYGMLNVFNLFQNLY